MDDLKVLPEGDWLGDHDESAWRWLLRHRGGCSCCVRPPCAACSSPISEEELNRVGFTYGQEPSNG